MEIDRNKAFKLLIVILGTLAALAVMSTMVQLIQTVLPFLIIGTGIYVGYRWALSDAEAPTADEVQEQARGWFDRFRRSKQAVETTVKVGATLQEMGEKADKARKTADAVVAGEATKVGAAKPPGDEAAAQDEAEEAGQAAKVRQVKAALKSDPGGAIEFKDRDVVISKDDVVQPDISRLEEKEKEEPEVTDNVMAQIEERRRRLHGGG
ncbi:MAG: hypothetical protein OXI40_15530 [Chloroflexota bacterium]|nr:hypothetical protein [Chloroflexota bacterium]